MVSQIAAQGAFKVEESDIAAIELPEGPGPDAVRCRKAALQDKDPARQGAKKGVNGSNQKPSTPSGHWQGRGRDATSALRLRMGGPKKDVCATYGFATHMPDSGAGGDFPQVVVLAFVFFFYQQFKDDAALADARRLCSAAQICSAFGQKKG